MADKKITELTELSETPASDDLIEIADVSDTTMSVDGTNKKITRVNLVNPDGWEGANETWTYASSDDPTYTLTISGDKTGKYSAGMRVKLTDSGTQYFIITKVAYGDPNTTLTLYGGTDYDLSEGTITNPCYSCMKAPFGFPLGPDKWTVETTDSTSRTQSPTTAGVWYNTGTITIDIPIGVWRVNYEVALQGSITGALVTAESTLSTANNSESDSDMTACTLGRYSASAGVVAVRTTVGREKIFNLSTKDTYYFNHRTIEAANVYSANDQVPLVISAICAYL